jgi:hypothetical protein
VQPNGLILMSKRSNLKENQAKLIVSPKSGFANTTFAVCPDGMASGKTLERRHISEDEWTTVAKNVTSGSTINFKVAQSGEHLLQLSDHGTITHETAFFVANAMRLGLGSLNKVSLGINGKFVVLHMSSGTLTYSASSKAIIESNDIVKSVRTRYEDRWLVTDANELNWMEQASKFGVFDLKSGGVSNEIEATHLEDWFQDQNLLFFRCSNQWNLVREYDLSIEKQFTGTIGYGNKTLCLASGDGLSLYSMPSLKLVTKIYQGVYKYGVRNGFLFERNGCNHIVSHEGDKYVQGDEEGMEIPLPRSWKLRWSKGCGLWLQKAVGTIQVVIRPFKKSKYIGRYPEIFDLDKQEYLDLLRLSIKAAFKMPLQMLEGYSQSFSSDCGRFLVFTPSDQDEAAKSSIVLDLQSYRLAVAPFKIQKVVNWKGYTDGFFGIEKLQYGGASVQYSTIDFNDIKTFVTPSNTDWLWDSGYAITGPSGANTTYQIFDFNTGKIVAEGHDFQLLNGLIRIDDFWYDLPHSVVGFKTSYRMWTLDMKLKTAVVSSERSVYLVEHIGTPEEQETLVLELPMVVKKFEIDPNLRYVYLSSGTITQVRDLRTMELVRTLPERFIRLDQAGLIVCSNAPQRNKYEVGHPRVFDPTTLKEVDPSNLHRYSFVSNKGNYYASFEDRQRVCVHCAKWGDSLAEIDVSELSFTNYVAIFEKDSFVDVVVVGKPSRGGGTCYWRRYILLNFTFSKLSRLELIKEKDLSASWAVWKVAFDTNRNRFAFYDSQAVTKVFDYLDSGSLNAEFPTLHRGRSFEAFSPNGKWFAASEQQYHALSLGGLGWNESSKLWIRNSEKETDISTFEDHVAPVKRAQFSIDGKMLASIDRNGVFILRPLTSSIASKMID